MKSLLLDKFLLILGTISILLTFKHTKDTIPPTKIKEEYKIDATLRKDTSLNTDSIINDAKLTIKAYNNSVKEKNLINSVLIKLTKKELLNVKETNKLIQLLIKKYSTNNNNVNIDKDVIQIDSICTNPSIFNKKKCKEYDILIYFVKDNKKILIQQLKTKN